MAWKEVMPAKRKKAPGTHWFPGALLLSPTKTRRRYCNRGMSIRAPLLALVGVFSLALAQPSPANPTSPNSALSILKAASTKILLFAPTLKSAPLADTLHEKVVSERVPLYLITDGGKLNLGSNYVATFALLTRTDQTYPIHIRTAPAWAFRRTPPFAIIDDKVLLFLPDDVGEWRVVRLSNLPGDEEKKRSALATFRWAARTFNYWWNRSTPCQLGLAQIHPVRLTCKRSEWFILQPEAWR